MWIIELIMSLKLMIILSFFFYIYTSVKKKNIYNCVKFYLN